MRSDLLDPLMDVVDIGSIANPPVPRRYGALRTGPSMDFEWEPNQQAPIDGSDPASRLLSPFVIRVEPPLILGSVGVKGGGIDLQAYGKAGRARGGFQRARTALSGTSYASTDFGMATPEEYIARGSAGRITSSSVDGSRSSSNRGTAETSDFGIPSIADLNVATDIAMQLSAIANMPPLVLLINPSSLNISYAKVQQFTDRTRFGYILQAWGEEQPKLSITAKCGAFISAERGVQSASMRDSASWQNLMSLFQFYKNAGYIHDTVGKSNAHHMVGALSISYDQWTYYGHMESFNWGHDESNINGGVEFQIEFVASSLYDGAASSTSVAPMSDPSRMGFLPQRFEDASTTGTVPQDGFVLTGWTAPETARPSISTTSTPKPFKR